VCQRPVPGTHGSSTASSAETIFIIPPPVHIPPI
jgi:hypothetical protein